MQGSKEPFFAGDIFVVGRLPGFFDPAQQMQFSFDEGAGRGASNLGIRVLQCRKQLQEGSLSCFDGGPPSQGRRCAGPHRAVRISQSRP